MQGQARVKHPPEVPCVIAVDRREPHEDANDHPDAVFRPRVFGATTKGEPWASRARIELPIERVTLSVGDYSLPKLTEHVAIERKSTSDLLSTLFGDGRMSALGEARHNLDRFRAELERARGYWLFAIIVEGSVNDLFRCARDRHERYGKSFDPFSALAILRSFAVDLAAPTIWCGSKGLAELEVGHTLARVWSQATRGEAYRKAVGRRYNPPWLGVLAGPGVSVQSEAELEAEGPALREMAERLGFGQA